MKESIRAQKKEKCKKNSSIILDLAEVYLTLIHPPLKESTKAPFKGELEAFNIFSIQNMRMGPPGGWIGPDGLYSLNPDKKTAARKGIKINQQKILSD